MTTKELTTMQAQTELDTTRVIESLVLRGDLSGLGPLQRAQFYMSMCEGLGLNPHAQPFAFLRLNGKEVLYATRGATDQLARIHKINREVTDGPRVMEMAGSKLLYAVCRATHPNGRVEVESAAIPLPAGAENIANALMKVVTKAKRRATLSILSLVTLDEVELETIPAHAKEPGGGVDLSLIPPPDAPQLGQGDREDPAAASKGDEPAETPPAETPPALEDFYQRVDEVELPGEAVAVWMKHRARLAELRAPDREAAWKALCKRTEDVVKMKNAKVWLKKAIAEEDQRATEKAARGDVDAVLSQIDGAMTTVALDRIGATVRAGDPPAFGPNELLVIGDAIKARRAEFAKAAPAEAAS